MSNDEVKQTAGFGWTNSYITACFTFLPNIYLQQVVQSLTAMHIFHCKTCDQQL